MALERKAFLQAMLSRPLVSATVMGALLGDVRAGLFVGMLLELFYLGTANLGAALPENDTVSATGTAAAAATMAAATGAGSTQALWSIAVLLFMPWGAWGGTLDRLLEGYMARLARVALASAEAGNLSRAVRQNLWGMWPHFVIYGVVTAFCALLGFFARDAGGPAAAGSAARAGVGVSGHGLGGGGAGGAGQPRPARAAVRGLGALVVTLTVILVDLGGRR